MLFEGPTIPDLLRVWQRLNKQPTEHETMNSNRPIDLEKALEIWEVNPPGHEGWWAVSNQDGIVAYFKSEIDACRYRLSEVNRMLNP